jgi:hypothetical protein
VDDHAGSGNDVGVVHRSRAQGALAGCGFTPGFSGAQSFVDDHFEVGLVAEAMLGGLDAGLGDVFRVEPDGGGGVALSA